MSLLMAEGHPQARRYPLAFLWSEARICRQRHNQAVMQEAAVMQAVIGASIGGKKGARHLSNLLKRIEHSD
ncbi:hypothetical protein [Pseudomonas citronellolis]|uniref:hypothetical protein n=1 Tax=Pseudomonas citronellolis TaxID=53408 RepID=UPI00248EC54B|nr:hypothetical protein [Pseudomonas citronellolis]